MQQCAYIYVYNYLVSSSSKPMANFQKWWWWNVVMGWMDGRGADLDLVCMFTSHPVKNGNSWPPHQMTLTNFKMQCAARENLFKSLPSSYSCFFFFFFFSCSQYKKLREFKKKNLSAKILLEILFSKIVTKGKFE